MGSGTGCDTGWYVGAGISLAPAWTTAQRACRHCNGSQPLLTRECTRTGDEESQKQRGIAGTCRECRQEQGRTTMRELARENTRWATVEQCRMRKTPRSLQMVTGYSSTRLSSAKNPHFHDNHTATRHECHVCRHCSRHASPFQAPHPHGNTKTRSN